jgi:hypothetical protein
MKRILHKITITEISAVDKPCVEGARAVIMKRADAPQAATTKRQEPTVSASFEATVAEFTQVQRE